MNRIKELREEIGMTQVRLSIELEVAQETISAYEQGKHYPSAVNLIKLSKIFSASIDYILGLSDCRYNSLNNRISTNEAHILLLYKQLPDNKKRLLEVYLKGLAVQ